MKLQTIDGRLRRGDGWVPRPGELVRIREGALLRDRFVNKACTGKVVSTGEGVAEIMIVDLGGDHEWLAFDPYYEDDAGDCEHGIEIDPFYEDAVKPEEPGTYEEAAEELRLLREALER